LGTSVGISIAINLDPWRTSLDDDLIVIRKFADHPVMIRGVILGELGGLIRSRAGSHQIPGGESVRLECSAVKAWR